MPVTTSQKWARLNSRWHSIEDLVLLFQLSFLEADLVPRISTFKVQNSSAGIDDNILATIKILAIMPG
ncbi:BQ2448_6026 [Microbotryum intermedium]|uniref:BQ2448_6026 protein n=1 Tax=Microbotryum intermedium TaxID=269621 RepID=A0A238EZT3_9BASI|nr:BQ2448_6026 [Microbotryum intermedium]